MDEKQIRERLNKSGMASYLRSGGYGDFAEGLMLDRDDVSFYLVLLLFKQCKFFVDFQIESNSVVVYADDGAYLRLHKPDKNDILKSYQVDEVIQFMRERDGEQ